MLDRIVRSTISVLICIALIVPPSLVSAPLELIYIDDDTLSRRELARLSRTSQGDFVGRENQTKVNPSEIKKSKNSKISDFFKRFFVYQAENSSEVDKDEVGETEVAKVDAAENRLDQVDAEKTEKTNENTNEGVVTEVAKETKASKLDDGPVLPKEFIYGKDEDKKEIISTKRSGGHVRDSLLKALHLLPDYFKKDARVVQYINDRLIPFMGNSTKNALKLSDFFLFLPGHRGQKNEIEETGEKKVVSDSEEVQKQNNLDKEEGKEKDTEQRATFFSRLFKRDPNRVRKYDGSKPEKVSLKKLLPFLVYSDQENKDQDDENEVVEITENKEEKLLTSENRKDDENELEIQEKIPVSSDQEAEETLTTAVRKDKTLIDIMKIEQAKSDDEIVEKLAYSDPYVKESIEVIALRDKLKSDEKLHAENSEENMLKSEKAEDIVELESDPVKESSALVSEKVEDEVELRTNTNEEDNLKIVSESVADNLKVDENAEDETKLKSDNNETSEKESSALVVVEVKDKPIKQRKRGLRKEIEGDAFTRFLLSLKDRVDQRSQDDWKPGGKDWFQRLRWFRPSANKKSEVDEVDEVDLENVDTVKGRGYATFVASVVDNETSAKTFFKRFDYKLNSFSTPLLMPLLNGDLVETQKSALHLHLYKEKVEDGTHIKLDKETNIFFDEIQDFHYLLIQNGRVRLKNESENMWIIVARENRIYVDRGDELVVDMTGELITKILTIEGEVDIYDDIHNLDLTLSASEAYEIGIVSSRTELDSSEVDFLNEKLAFKVGTSSLKNRHIAARSFLTTLQNKDEIVSKSKPRSLGSECKKCSYQLKNADKIQKYCPQCYQSL